MKDMFEDLLLPQGSNYHGTKLETDEALTPLSESFIVIQWLNSIDPKLPKHIKENRTQWFNDETPTWADIQSLIVDNIDTLLLECNRTGEDAIDSARIGQFNSQKKRGNMTKNINTRTQYRSRFCEICKNAGKEEAVYTSHWVTRCRSLSNAAKQACARASLRALLADDDEVFSDHEEVSDSSDI